MTKAEAAAYVDELLNRREPLRSHTIDPATGIWPMSEWGTECGRGFVSDMRFSGGKDRVIKRTNRSMTRKFRKSAA